MSDLQPHYPQRIVCLTEETTETLYLLGEQDRIVGISGFTVRPPEARREKPKVSAFTSAKTDRILALNPDLVIGFSDLQADIGATLVRAGVTVWMLNHRSVHDILNMMLMLSSMVGAQARGGELVEEYRQMLVSTRARSEALSTEHSAPRPRVYFEEWDDPLISGIRWVSELVSIAGGDDCFESLSVESLGKNRIIADPNQVIEAQPDIIIGSWCGKKFRAERVRERPGWDAIPAVRDNELHEIKSVNILQPGPAAIKDGLAELFAIISRWRHEHRP